MASALESPAQILLVPDGRAGGLFLGASQFWAIRHRYPEARVVLLVTSAKEYIAREIPFADDVIVFEEFLLPWGSKYRHVVQQLREQSFDIAFCFSSEDSLCPAYLCYKSGAHLRIGFQREDYPFFNIRIVPRPDIRQEPERLSLILRTLGIPQVKERVSWSVSREGAQKIRQRYLANWDPGERFVAIDVSSGTGPRPTPRQFRFVAEGAVALPDTRALVFFDYAERKTANLLKEELGQKVLLFQTDDLPRIVALLEVCGRLISCNTDLFHLAVAMGLPVTGVFSNQDVERWAPDDRERIDIFDLDSLKAWSPKQIGDLIRQRLTTVVQANE